MKIVNKSYRLSKTKKANIQDYIMEEEDKIKVEEATVNLSCVKEELEEFECSENQYRIVLNYKNIFGDSLKTKRENIDSFIGFLDHDVIMEMEMGTIKLDVKDEDHLRKIIEQSYCNGCGGNYKSYCLNCSSLSHILNNVTPNINLKSDLNTTPIDVLEIREIAMRRAVFTLKDIPKGIILGPFDGVVPIKNTTGLQWKIKNKKIINDQHANWMKYIESVTNPFLKNLDIFQFDGLLYFETSREIQEGEELLVCYCEEKEVLKSDSDEETYLVPVVKEFPNVFACTLCCLGFHLEECLVEHKSKCPHEDHYSSIEDFKIIQCHCCKVWLEKREHHKGHMVHCLNYYKLHHDISDSRLKSLDEINEIRENRKLSTPINDDKSYLSQTEAIHSRYTDGIGETNEKGYFIENKHKYSECTFQTNRKVSLKEHLNTHKQMECNICKKRFTRKTTLKKHIKNQHSNMSEKKYKCSVCSFGTNYKSSLKTHVSTHNDTKQFECNICKNRFSNERSLQEHSKNRHSNISEKDYKCPECPYQTNRKGDLKTHLNTHKDIKPFECDICKNRFTAKNSLKDHVRNLHSNTSEKEYKCSTCSYQTNYKSSLRVHLSIHNDTKPFECDICKNRFSVKGNLKKHILIRHSNTSEKEYKCSKCPYQNNRKQNLRRHLKDHHSNTNEKEYKCCECSYQTNHKSDLKQHSITHSGIKSFECGICKNRYAFKNSLKKHILYRHSNTSEKEYKCSECSYETNHKWHLKRHLNTHYNCKPFACDICKSSFSLKRILKGHIKNRHSNTNEKEYKCSQ